MKRFRFNVLASIVLGLAIVVLSMAVTSGQEQKPADKAKAEIETLVKQLGSTNAATREGASQRLLKIGEEALPFLKTATRDADLETRRRAEGLHAQISESARDKLMKARTQKATSLGIDYFVRRMVRDRKSLTDGDWEILSQLEEEIKKVGRAKGLGKGILSRLNYKQFTKIRGLKFNDGGKGIFTSTCLTADSIKGDTVFTKSLCVCKDAIDAKLFLTDSVVIMGNGAPVRVRRIDGSVLLIGGDFESDGAVCDTVIVAAGDVKMALATNVVVIAQGKVVIRGPIECDVREKAPVVFDKVGFFTPESVGVELASVNKTIRVMKIRDASTLHKAGVSEGDELLNLGGIPLESVDQFRRLLLNAVLEKESTLLVSRNKAEIKVRLRFENE